MAWCLFLDVKLTVPPRVIMTDRLKSYSAAKAELLPGIEHGQQNIKTTAIRILISQPGCESVY